MAEAWTDNILGTHREGIEYRIGSNEACARAFAKSFRNSIFGLQVSVKGVHDVLIVWDDADPLAENTKHITFIAPSKETIEQHKRLEREVPSVRFWP